MVVLCENCGKKREFGEKYFINEEYLSVCKDCSLKEFIRKEHGEYCVYSHQTGKNFGCYKTKGEAEARLAQMHKFRGK